MTKCRAIILCVYLAMFLAAIIFSLQLAHKMLDNMRTLREYEPQSQAEQQQISDLQRRVGYIERTLGRAGVFTVTAYAPLDPRAIEGMCYSGDPTVTASGGRPVPFRTVAASREFGFGQRLWLEGVGVVEVNDRGGAIKDGMLDLVLPTREHAQQWGRRELRVIPQRKEVRP